MDEHPTNSIMKLQDTHSNQFKEGNQNPINLLIQSHSSIKKRVIIHFFPFLISVFLLFFYIIPSRDRKVSELIRILAGCNNTKVVPQLLFLEVPLGEILELPLGELNVRWSCYSKLSAVATDADSISGEVGRLSFDFDAVLEVLLEGSNIEYLIVDWGGTVDYKFYRSFLSLNLQTRGNNDGRE